MKDPKKLGAIQLLNDNFGNVSTVATRFIRGDLSPAMIPFVHDLLTDKEIAAIQKTIPRTLWTMDLRVAALEAAIFGEAKE